MTLTLLDAVNRTLSKLGEQRVASVTSNELAIIATNAVEDSYYMLAQESSSWPWLTAITVADSWVNEEATLSGRLLSVRFIRDAGTGRRLAYIPEDEFFYKSLASYTGTNGGAKWYTIVGEKFYFNPYPSDADSRADIKFHASLLPTFPQNDTGVISIPQRDETLLVLRSAMTLSVDHLGDVGRAQFFGDQYSRLLNQAKVRLVTDVSDQRRSAIR